MSEPNRARTINHLPMSSASDFSPYYNLEFDLSVQEYCRNKSNHISRKANDSDSTRRHSNSYDTVNTPFNRVVRGCKVVLSGDVAVGKTCLVNRFGHDVYSDSYQTTIGVDFDVQKFNILGQPFVLQIWDTAGLERFKCITSSYYRGCQAALLVFDMSNLNTLANVLKWKDDILQSSKTYHQQCDLDTSATTTTTTTSDKSTLKQQNGRATDSDQTPLLFLVGTKSDLKQNEASCAFIKEQANRIACLLQAELWFVSAQTGDNVKELFNRVAALSFNRCILSEIQRCRFEASTIGACLKEKIIQQQKELWLQSSKLIKITRKKPGDDRRTKCVNIQCVIK